MASSPPGSGSGSSPGPVALVGSGEFLPVMDDVDRELLAGRPPRVVFLPTAAAQDGPERVDEWVRLGTGHFRRLGADPVALRVLDRAAADTPDVAARVAGAGLVYLSGGNPGFLADTLRGTALLAAIVDAWSSGAALAGCSAGACALTAVAEDMRPGRDPAYRPGLGVVPRLVVLPHFDVIDGWFPGIVDRRLAQRRPGEVVVGIDEETAMVGGPDRWTVRGRGNVWVFGDGPDPARYGPGAPIDLAAGFSS